MSKLSRLRDFQIHAALGLTRDVARPLYGAMFATSEPVRLWLKDRRFPAPFQKILVSLSDERTARPWHGHVMNALGVCEITEAVDVSTLAKDLHDHRWLLGVVVHALECVAKATGWRALEFEAFIANLRERSWPLMHYFDHLARVDKRTGATCVPWFSTRPGEATVGVRIGSRDVAIMSGPIMLEDDFPIAKTIIKGREYVLRDRAGRTLASVSIDTSERAASHRGPVHKGASTTDSRAALDERDAEFRLGEAPLIADLCAAGFLLESAQDLIDSPGSYTRAAPLLIMHLRRPYPPAVRELIARSLGHPGANLAWGAQDSLMRLFREERDERVRDLLAAAAAITADDDAIER